jgi:hypothetical protein
VGYFKFKSFNNVIKTWWIFVGVGCTSLYQKYKDLESYTEIETLYHSKQVECNIIDLGLTNYEIYTFFLQYKIKWINGIDVSDGNYLPDNYVPKYRKL